nr:gag protein [Colletotrichum truncatum]KAF6797905.1 gag protein [Colletotrichum truncatum]
MERPKRPEIYDHPKTGKAEVLNEDADYETRAQALEELSAANLALYKERRSEYMERSKTHEAFLKGIRVLEDWVRDTVSTSLLKSCCTADRALDRWVYALKERVGITTQSIHEAAAAGVPGTELPSIWFPEFTYAVSHSYADTWIFSYQTVKDERVESEKLSVGEVLSDARRFLQTTSQHNPKKQAGRGAFGPTTEATSRNEEEGERTSPARLTVLMRSSRGSRGNTRSRGGARRDRLRKRSDGESEGNRLCPACLKPHPLSKCWLVNERERPEWYEPSRELLANLDERMRKDETLANRVRKHADPGEPALEAAEALGHHNAEADAPKQVEGQYTGARFEPFPTPEASPPTSFLAVLTELDVRGWGEEHTRDIPATKPIYKKVTPRTSYKAAFLAGTTLHKQNPRRQDGPRRDRVVPGQPRAPERVSEATFTVKSGNDGADEGPLEDQVTGQQEASESQEGCSVVEAFETSEPSSHRDRSQTLAEETKDLRARGNRDMVTALAPTKLRSRVEAQGRKKGAYWRDLAPLPTSHDQLQQLLKRNRRRELEEDEEAWAKRAAQEDVWAVEDHEKRAPSATGSS